MLGYNPMNGLIETGKFGTPSVLNIKWIFVCFHKNAIGLLKPITFARRASLEPDV